MIFGKGWLYSSNSAIKSNHLVIPIPRFFYSPAGRGSLQGFKLLRGNVRGCKKLKDVVRCFYMALMKALKTNRIVSSPAYAKILHCYNEELRDRGKVNDKKFFETFVKPDIPNYSLQSWYKFLKRFKTEVGLIAAEPTLKTSMQVNINAVEGVKKVMLSNQMATASLIQKALNISEEAAQKLIENPELLTTKERVELGLKAMKAQDSRIHAVGKLREDNREQERFDRTFADASY